MFQIATITEYQNLRVLTTAQLAEAFGTDSNTITVNFSRNKDRYTDGKHYFLLRGEDLAAYKSNLTDCNVASNVNRLYLWTEKGAWMHAKSLNTDQAWNAYEMLVDDYYRIKSHDLGVVLPTNYLEALEHLIEQVKQNQQLQGEKLMLEQRVAEYAPKANYVDQILQSKDTVTVTQIAKDYGLTAQKLNAILHEDQVQFKVNDQWVLYRKFQDQGLTKSQTVDIVHSTGEHSVKMHTEFTQKGRLFIHELLKRREIVPYMDREHELLFV